MSEIVDVRQKKKAFKLNVFHFIASKLSATFPRIRFTFKREKCQGIVSISKIMIGDTINLVFHLAKLYHPLP